MSTMAISAKDVAELRARTGAGMMDCKKALEEAGGDMDKAAEILRKKGIAKAEKRAGRTASQGLVGDRHRAGRAVRGAMIELNCETDFVARTDDFIALAKELCASTHAAHAPVGVNPGSALDAQPFQGKTVAEVGQGSCRARPAKRWRSSGSRGSRPRTVSSAPISTTTARSACLVELEGPRSEARLRALARELALHVASADPERGVRPRPIVPAELIDARAADRRGAGVRRKGSPRTSGARSSRGRSRSSSPSGPCWSSPS